MQIHLNFTKPSQQYRSSGRVLIEVQPITNLTPDFFLLFLE